MIRLIVKRRQTCRISGLDREWFETFDADLPEVERALGGGFGENGSLAGSVIGAEVITELPQDAGDDARVTDAERHDMERKARELLAVEYERRGSRRMAEGIRSTPAAEFGDRDLGCAVRAIVAALAAREPDDGARVTDGVALIAAERRRQMDVEGWTPEHDDEHAWGELALAAVCYAMPESGRGHPFPRWWPWDASWWKPSDRIRELVKAGALIAAEIERLQRAAAARGGGAS